MELNIKIIRVNSHFLVQSYVFLFTKTKIIFLFNLRWVIIQFIIHSSMLINKNSTLIVVNLIEINLNKIKKQAFEKHPKFERKMAIEMLFILEWRIIRGDDNYSLNNLSLAFY